MTFQEILQVKDDILKNNRELEQKIKSHIDIYGNKFKEDINSFSARIQKVTDNNEKIVKMIPDINYKISKIDQMEKIGIRADHKMNSFEVRISTILEHIEKMRTKYDKIILDNLFVSGQIGGAHCPYANLSEYLTSNIADVSLLKSEKDQMKKDLKNLKSKNETIIKQTVNLVDGSVKRCNAYTDNKQKDFQLLLDTRMREFNEKVMEIRMNVCKIQMQTEEAVNNLNIGFDKLKEENKFFTEDILEKFKTMKNEFIEFKNEYQSKLNILNKENTNIKKDNKDIKENIESIVRFIEYQNTRNIQDIRNNFNDESIEEEIKKNKLKGSYLSLMNKNANSRNKLSLMPLSPSIRKNKNKLLNSVNAYEQSQASQVRRNKKKRNTVAYTKPIFDTKLQKQLKQNINDKCNVDAHKFIGLFKNLKNININNDRDKSIRINKSSNIKNDEDSILDSTIKSINIDKDNKSKNNSKNSGSEKSSNSRKNSNSNSNSDSESNSFTVSMTDSNEEKNNKPGLNIRRSSSKKIFTKLSLKNDTRKLSKKHNINNPNLLNIKNQKHNKNGRRRASVGIFGSVNNMYKNNDISDILSKKFSNPSHKNKLNQIIQERDEISKHIKNSYNDESKVNYSKNNNIIISQKEKDNMIKNNGQKPKIINTVNISNNNRLIESDNNNQILRNLMKISDGNNRYSNTIDMYSPTSKNHKRNYIFTPIGEDPGINCNYKIVSFDIPENTKLPQKMTQIYSLNGKKLKKKPIIKQDYISPLDELYKQQYKKKIKDMKNSSNPNINIINVNDIPKKLLPIFGRTAYAYYIKNEKDGGINLTNSVDFNKNKNTMMNFYSHSRNNINMNNIQTNNSNMPFNIKSFPKIRKNYKTEKNES